jgi:diacylglycerol kinase
VKQPSLWRSFGHAITGVIRTWTRERNFRLHVAVAAAVTVMSLVVQISRVEWAVLVFAMGLVFTAELFNTTVEAAVDLLSPEYHETAKTAKDAAAGAVLLSALTAAIVGLLILGPPLWLKLRGG